MGCLVFIIYADPGGRYIYTCIADCCAGLFSAGEVDSQDSVYETRTG